MANSKSKNTRPRMRVDGGVSRPSRHSENKRRQQDANSPVHVGPLRRFLRFAGSSLICTALDQLLAAILFFSLRRPMHDAGFLRILVASVIARIFSQALNYALNHRLVFACSTTEERHPSRRESLPRFLVVASIILALSSIGVYLLHANFGIPESFAKLGVDGLLFFLNYYLQHNWVFTSEPTINPRKVHQRRRAERR